MLNSLAKDLGLDIPYPDVLPELVGGTVKIKPDQFFNKPLATAVRDFLTMKGEATDWDEIVKALREGGFSLSKTKDAEESARLTILRNTANFTLVPDNYFGLKEWYGKLKKEKKTSQQSDNNSEKPKRPPKLVKPSEAKKEKEQDKELPN
jgi:hypothetical protein